MFYNLHCCWLLPLAEMIDVLQLFLLLLFLANWYLIKYFRLWLLEFNQWKTEEEDTTTCRYVKGRRDVKRADGVVRRAYYCHHSGRYVPQGKGVRHLKVQGSCKTGVFCPASILAKILQTGI